MVDALLRRSALRLDCGGKSIMMNEAAKPNHSVGKLKPWRNMLCKRLTNKDEHDSSPEDLTPNEP